MLKPIRKMHYLNEMEWIKWHLWRRIKEIKCSMNNNLIMLIISLQMTKASGRSGSWHKISSCFSIIIVCIGAFPTDLLNTVQKSKSICLSLCVWERARGFLCISWFQRTKDSLAWSRSLERASERHTERKRES